MDIKNLETASDYINNLLLSRGLLRNGESISFAHPSQGEGGKQATIAKVINLVHDLILRRDVSMQRPQPSYANHIKRESDTLTKLSQDVATLRTSSIHQVQTIHKLEVRAAELERQLALKSASEKSAVASLKTAESKNKSLKEDMTRLKATVGQIRAQCANEVRKKETELRRLQKYLEAKRGREGSIQVGITVVNPGASMRGSSGSNGPKHHAQHTLLDDTTEYLTQLGRELSIENEALRQLAHSTTSNLRQLQGLPEPLITAESDYNGAISQASTMPYENLKADLKDVLDQLGSLLTNPSFVPLEEVEIREEEILRLREGWEKMETRWREALSLMNGWSKRMMETGDAINLDDLRKGLILGSTPIKMPPPTSARKGRLSAGQIPSPDDSLVDDKSTSMSLDQQEETLRKALHANAEAESPVAFNSEERLGMGLFPAPKVLQPTTGNTQRIPRPRRRSVERGNDREESRQSPVKKRRLSQHVVEPELDDILLGTELQENQLQLDVDVESEEDQTSPLTIEEKLSQAKREAEAAATALKKATAVTATKVSPKRTREDAAVKSSTAASKPAASTVNTMNTNRQRDGEQAKPVKRTRVPTRIGAGGTRRSKRRSTLLPEELAELIGA